MAKLFEVTLVSLSPAGLPARSFWMADPTHREKPYAKRITVAGRAQHLTGHCYMFAAHLYKHPADKASQWASVLVGALLYVKGRSIPVLVGALVQHLRLPAQVRHVWLVDRGILSRPLLRARSEVGHCVLGRVRCNQAVYFAPPSEARQTATHKRRARVYGQNAGWTSCVLTVWTACVSRRWCYGCAGASGS